ncbi:MAG: two-component system response regulator [Desulfuromonadales bacterium C00003094]|jgi:two-component system response regulator|nr:MAG: two-component system response regulator [Desulfuromonadales bacterium C00003094]
MKKTKNILLVEDNPDDELLTLRALRKNRIDNPVVVVRDGAEALDYLFSRGSYADCSESELPVVVLLDLKLPKIGGLEVLERLRLDQRTRLLPVVVLTSSREEQDVKEAYLRGANSYIRKPVDFNHFLDAVGQLGNYWLKLNEQSYQ